LDARTDGHTDTQVFFTLSNAMHNIGQTIKYSSFFDDFYVG